MAANPLVIVGASVRAAAMSALRAGFMPYGIDLFADRDLQRIAACQRVDDYPNGIVSLLENAPPGPWMYTGGLENHPALIEELSQRRTLLGATTHVLNKVRDPHWLTAHVRLAPVVVDRSDVKANCRYIAKPRHSAGGRGIAFWDGAVVPETHFLQEFMPGRPVSGIFVGEQFIGATWQLVGQEWCHAAPFVYCGSVGPLAPEDRRCAEWSAIGKALAGQGGLTGVYGVDAIESDDGLVVVEVNPRYTASVEVLEHSAPLRRLRDAANQAGKAIYFAPHDLLFPASGPWDADLVGPFDPWRIPGFADIPAAGERIPAGTPVLTYFVEAPDASMCAARLRERAAELDSLLKRPDLS